MCISYMMSISNAHIHETYLLVSGKSKNMCTLNAIMGTFSGCQWKMFGHVLKCYFLKELVYVYCYGFQGPNCRIFVCVVGAWKTGHSYQVLWIMSACCWRPFQRTQKIKVRWGCVIFVPNILMSIQLNIITN